MILSQPQPRALILRRLFGLVFLLIASWMVYTAFLGFVGGNAFFAALHGLTVIVLVAVGRRWLFGSRPS